MKEFNNQEWSFVFVFVLIGLVYALSKTITVERILSNVVRVCEAFTCKIPKKNLVEYYGVNKKTFSNWVRVFCVEIEDFHVYKKRRKLEVYEAVYIVSILGFPEDYPIMNKKEIIEREESNYQCLRENCSVFGLTKEDFIQIRKFPPDISKSIAKNF